MTDKLEENASTDKRDRTFLAIILILAGVVTLLFNFVTVSESLALLLFPLLGVVFLAWGLITWRYGFTIPGCIITGLGAGVWLTQQMTNLQGEAEGGIIVLGLAFGFLGIALMNILFKQKAYWWPLIPGIILGVVGLLLTISTQQSLDLLDVIGRYWPIVLVLIGLWLLFGRPRQQQT
ncbi:MAG: hypothetical protein KJ065_24330 [Anaerolineae bacterium]|nr:hypothetical protein [Anaerolineae bacterium]